MASNNVNLGTGAATGMFFHAPANTALPSYPTESLGADWTEVGYISDAGITWHHGRSAEPLKDWSNSIRRQLQSDATGTVTAPIISTTNEVLETLFGSGNVSAATATTAHGALNSVDVEEGVMSGEEAFLFLMKDGDDMIMIGTKRGYISELGEVAFQPNNAITWNATITADTWVIMKDNGQATS